MPEVGGLALYFHDAGLSSWVRPSLSNVLSVQPAFFAAVWRFVSAAAGIAGPDFGAEAVTSRPVVASLVLVSPPPPESSAIATPTTATTASTPPPTHNSRCWRSLRAASACSAATRSWRRFSFCS